MGRLDNDSNLGSHLKQKKNTFKPDLFTLVTEHYNYTYHLLSIDAAMLVLPSQQCHSELFVLIAVFSAFFP